MNTFAKTSLFFSLLLLFFACADSAKQVPEETKELSPIKSISHGIHVDTNRYTFAPDRSDIYSFKGKTYSLRQKGEVKEDGSLSQLTVYKKDGVQLYGKEAFAENPAILNANGVSLQMEPVLLERGAITFRGKKMTINDQDPDEKIYLIREKISNKVRYTFFELY